MKIINLFEMSPIIAAVKNDDGLEKALKSDCEVVFILYGDICSIRYIVHRVKESGKTAIVHADLVSGLSTRDVSVDFIKENTKADGILSTKINLVRRAKEIGIYGGLRAFVIDSMALNNAKTQIENFRPDFMEIMPGIAVKAVKEIKRVSNIPIIAGGLLSTKEDIMDAFKAGADAVSTTKESLWYE